MSKRAAVWGAWAVLAVAMAVLGCSRPPATAGGRPNAPPPREPAAGPPKPEPKQPIPIEVPTESGRSDDDESNWASPQGHVQDRGRRSSAGGHAPPRPTAETVSISDLAWRSRHGRALLDGRRDGHLKKIAASIVADIQADAVSAYGAKRSTPWRSTSRTPPRRSPRFTQAKVGFPILMDPSGDYFSQVATERLPRIYVLDRDGKIAWFDVDYSRRRDGF